MGRFFAPLIGNHVAWLGNLLDGLGTFPWHTPLAVYGRAMGQPVQQARQRHGLIVT